MRMIRQVAYVAMALLACWPSGNLSGQSSDAGSALRPPLLPREREIALARSAAPPEVSDRATVLVLARGKGFVVAEPGTNGVTCLVDRSWPDAIEPHCFDPEGSRTILPVHARQMELREQGLSKASIQADIADGYRTGRFVVPARPALTWMMSAEQILYNDDGMRVGAWIPGRPTANLLIVMPDIVPVRIVGEGRQRQPRYLPRARRRATRARDNWLFEVPGEIPSIFPISSWEYP